MGALPAEVLLNIQSELVLNPQRGDIVKGLMAFERHEQLTQAHREDKSGSYRYLYLYLEHAGRIHLLYLFSKGDRADLSPDQTRIIGALSQQIRRESES